MAAGFVDRTDQTIDELAKVDLLDRFSEEFSRIIENSR
jgi:hypothetical protein